MNILIVDDETPARSELRYILETLHDDSTFFEAAGGETAISLLDQEPVDVVFLDIQMPGDDGLAVAMTIMERPDPPLIVFATAYDEHAVRAFELAALDYVLKPFDEHRLALTLERIESAMEERSLGEQRRHDLRAYLREQQVVGGVTKLWGQQDNDSWMLVDYADIMWAVAESRHVHIHIRGGDQLAVRHTLKELEARLQPSSFVRVHRSYLVNLDYVNELVPWFSGNYLIRIADEQQTEIPLSRRYVPRLKELTGW